MKSRLNHNTDTPTEEHQTPDGVWLAANEAPESRGACMTVESIRATIIAVRAYREHTERLQALEDEEDTDAYFGRLTSAAFDALPRRPLHVESKFRALARDILETLDILAESGLEPKSCPACGLELGTGHEDDCWWSRLEGYR